MFDKDNNGFLEENEVPLLLKETYRIIGIHYKPTKEDIKGWMAMTDENKDGQISIEEYERMIIKSLKIDLNKL